MATLRGKGAMQNVPMIVRAREKSAVEKDGKIIGQYLDVQVDQSLKNPDKVRTGEAQADSNPHLASYETKHPNGGTYVAHTVFYSQSQVDAIKEAAGKKVSTLENGDTIYGIRGDIMQNAKKQLLIATNKPMEPTNNPQFGKNTLDKQANVTVAAREYRQVNLQKPSIGVKAPEKDDMQAEM